MLQTHTVDVPVVMLADVESKVEISYFMAGTYRSSYMSSSEGGIIVADGSTSWLYHRQKLYDGTALVAHVNNEGSSILTVTQTK